MIEDALAEQLLLGRYPPGTRSRSTHAEDGLTIEAARGEDPRRGRRRRAAWLAPGEPHSSARRAARPSPLGGPVPHVRRLEHPRRDGRDRAPARRAPGSPAAPPAAVPSRWRSRRLPTVPPSACRPGSTRSTGCSGAASCPGSLLLSAASPASASPRWCSRSPAASRRRAPASCTRPARSRRARSTCAPRASGWSGPPRTRVAVLGDERGRRDHRGRAVATARARRGRLDPDGDRRRAGWARRAASARCANPRCGSELAKGDGIAVLLVGHVTKDG